MISSFSDFYSNLSSNGIFFFWIVVFLVVFLLFLAVILVIKNNRLSKLLKENEFYSEENTNTNEKITKIEDIPVISEEIQEKPVLVQDDVKIESKEEIKKENVTVNEEVKSETIEPVLYQKNVLREVNPRRQTSPIHIDNQDNINDSIIEDNSFFNDDTFGINLGEDLSSPLESMEDSFEVNDNMKFASEIVKQMEEEIKPSNIELTDYEKKQEEEAIISYDELLKVKDKIYNITEDEETEEFIDELKSFRLDLQ